MTAKRISCVVADEEKQRGTAAEHALANDLPASDSRRSEAAVEQAHVLAAADALLA